MTEGALRLQRRSWAEPPPPPLRGGPPPRNGEDFYPVPLPLHLAQAASLLATRLYTNKRMIENIALYEKLGSGPIKSTFAV